MIELRQLLGPTKWRAEGFVGEKSYKGRTADALAPGGDEGRD
jgi:hypothetical protein